MARNARTGEAAPRPRRSATVWPWIFGVLLLIALMVLLAWGFGWWDPETADELAAA